MHLYDVAPPPGWVISSAEVHVRHASLEQPAAHVNQLAQMLSCDERARAERFHFERDRRRFVVAQGLLRMLLGKYLDIEPHQLQFGQGPHGKPYLKSPNSWAIRFNQAHSHELALYAFTCGREVGIDVERICPLPDAEQIAARFFSAAENAMLCALPEDQRLEAFFNCWTRKEAFLKAAGDGLTRPLDQFQVSLAPGEPARLLVVEQAPQEVLRWRLESLTPVSGYVAAIVVEGHDWRLRCWQCDPNDRSAWPWGKGS